MLLLPKRIMKRFQDLVQWMIVETIVCSTGFSRNGGSFRQFIPSKDGITNKDGSTSRKSQAVLPTQRSKASLVFLSIALTVSGFGGVGSTAIAQENLTEEPAAIELANASREGELAISTFQYPKTWSAQLWAAEPMMGNPVVFTIDNQGRMFVCESYRQDTCVTDNRQHDDVWLDRDLAAQTVEDRIAYHKELLPEKGVEYTRYDDVIRMLVDSDGDGKADEQNIWADRFNQMEMGTGAGVLVNGDDVYYTCIPDLWLLRDQDKDGKAEFRKSLSTGYGVRVAFRGHDMHGPIIGPDGRLYFSIGDRGYHVVTVEGKKLHDPASGAVFRCELDGSKLEVFATGLRNPQELAFDAHGNLFTGDNNSDGGDKARWVYVAEGSDSGWRMYYQYMDDRGPFSREKVWHPYHRDQPAFIVPPVINIADGPSGLAYYPGTGLSEDFDGRFFLSDFRGASAVSGIRTFRSRPKGAFFELTDAEQTIWRLLATDVQFGPDGWVYVSDWVNGWQGENKGRIYRFGDPAQVESALVKEVQNILKNGLSNELESRLIDLMNHKDQRVRQIAQFELVDQKSDTSLMELARSGSALLGRLHAIWGIGQRIRSERGGSAERSEASSRLENFVVELLASPDSELRAQAAKLVGDLNLTSSADKLVGLMGDPEPRVQYFACVSIGKLNVPNAVGPLVELLAANDGEDPAIRHACIMGLLGQTGGGADLVDLARATDSVEVQRCLAVVLRKQRDSRVSEFLNFATDQLVREEVARAIYDVTPPTGLQVLADELDSAVSSEPFLLRSMGACNYLGGSENAEKLARFASDQNASSAMRVQALNLLANWQAPSSRDPIIGIWRPIKERAAQEAIDSLLPVFDKLLDANEVASAAIDAVEKLELRGADEALVQLCQNKNADAELRRTAMLALSVIDSRQLAKLVEAGFRDDAVAVRMAAREVSIAKQFPAASSDEFWSRGIESSDMQERQHTIGLLAHENLANSSKAKSLLANLMARLIAGEVADTDRLDIVMAVEKRRDGDDEQMQELLRTYRKTFDQTDLSSKFRDALQGGDAARGEDLFWNNSAVYCQRCHKVGSSGGAVGPNLSDIGKKKERQYLLEAIVDPNKAIAENFETTVILDLDGNNRSGIVRKETDEFIQIVDADAKLITIDKEEIDLRRKGKSAMPEDSVKYLSPKQIRDLVSFLAALQTEPEPEDAVAEGHQ